MATMTPQQRELWQKTVILLVRHIDDSAQVLEKLGVSSKLADKFAEARQKITPNQEPAFKKWLAYLLYEKFWKVDGETVSIELGSVKQHELSFDGIVKCLISSMNRFAMMGVPEIPIWLKAEYSGFPGYMEAQTIADSILEFGCYNEEDMAAFTEVSGRSGMKAVFKTLLAGSSAWLDKFSALMACEQT